MAKEIVRFVQWLAYSSLSLRFDQEPTTLQVQQLGQQSLSRLGVKAVLENLNIQHQGFFFKCDGGISSASLAAHEHCLTVWTRRTPWMWFPNHSPFVQMVNGPYWMVDEPICLSRWHDSIWSCKWQTLRWKDMRVCRPHFGLRASKLCCGNITLCMLLILLMPNCTKHCLFTSKCLLSVSRLIFSYSLIRNWFQAAQSATCVLPAPFSYSLKLATYSKLLKTLCFHR